MLCITIKMIEIYLLIVAYPLKTSLLTHRNAIKRITTKQYLTKNKPSLNTIANLFLHKVRKNINTNRIKRLRLNRYTDDAPIH